MPLVLCPACSRHVHAREPACPFCAAPPSALGPAPRAGGGLSRAMLFGGALAVAATEACVGAIAPVYGGPAQPPETRVEPPAADAAAAPETATPAAPTR